MKHFFMMMLVGLFLASPNGFCQSNISGLIINDSTHPLADRIVDLLAMRWHFGRSSITSNLVVRDVYSNPGSQKISFSYDGSVIKYFNIPRARLKAGILDAVAVDVYQAAIKADVEKKSLLLDRLSNIN